MDQSTSEFYSPTPEQKLKGVSDRIKEYLKGEEPGSTRMRAFSYIFRQALLGAQAERAHEHLTSIGSSGNSADAVRVQAEYGAAIQASYNLDMERVRDEFSIPGFGQEFEDIYHEYTTLSRIQSEISGTSAAKSVALLGVIDVLTDIRRETTGAVVLAPVLKMHL